MDPHLIDLLWEVHREVGAKEAIWIICGYRSPETNSMLRRRSSGVAEFSQHTLGKAIDFYIPGVPLERLREVGLRAQRGGVGFYPTSGHPSCIWTPAACATGRACRKRSSPACWRRASSNPLRRKPTRQRSAPSLFARLFGGGRDEDEDAKTAAAPAKPARKPATAPEARTEKPAVVAAAAESRIEKVADGAAAAGQTGQAGELPGRVGNLEARRQADPRLRVFGDRRRAGKLRSRVGNLQAGASRAGSGSGRAHRRVGNRHHQRARLLAGTAEHRGRGRAASRHARNGSRSPPRRRRRHRQRRSSDHGKRHALAADRSRRQRADPECSRLRGAAHSDRDRAYAADGPGNVACRTRCAAGNDHRGQAHRRSSVIGRGAQHHQGQRGAGGRSFQRSLDARHDREPERAELHEDDPARRHGLPQSRSVSAKAGDDGDDDVLERSVSRHDLRKIRRQRGGLRIDRHIQHGSR